MPGLRYCTPDGLLQMARATLIKDRRTSKRTFWDVTSEQVKFWTMLHDHQWSFGAKPRKVGWSLAGVFAYVHETDAADSKGNRVRTVFAIDKDDKALEHVERAADMAQQWGIRVRTKYAAPRSLTFKNGSRFDFLTMGQEEPGRSGDIDYLQITELPYAENPERAFVSLRTACTDSAAGTIETTLTTLDPFTAALWRGKRRNPHSRIIENIGTEFVRFTSFVQDQPSYRMTDEEACARRDAHAERIGGPLTDEEWAWCQKEGFTDKQSGTWWLREALENKCAGDRIALMHDYPQLDRHLLAASAGRVIEATPELAVVDGMLDVTGMRGDTWSVEVYIDLEQEDHSGQIVIVIDSAQGVGKTNSVVLAVDKRDRRILACFWDNTILHDDLARVAQWVAGLFQSRRRHWSHKDRVTVVCEADGAGRHTAHELTFLGVPHDLFWQSKDGNSERCVTQAKRRIEANPRGAPLVLQEECDELKRSDDGKNKLEGRKDCIMMYGLANVWIDQHPYEQPVDVEHEKERRSRMTYEASVRDHEMQQRVRARWGI